MGIARTPGVGGVLWAGLALCIASSVARAQMCPGDMDLDGDVTIAEVQQSANAFLYGCPIERRFVDNGDGTISDYGTGLMWEKKLDFDDDPIFCSSAVECPDPHDADNRYSWSVGEPYDPTGTAFTVLLAQLNGACDGDSGVPCTVNAECAGIGSGLCGFAGRRDWRLPTRDELVGIVDYAAMFPPVIDAVFHSDCARSCERGACSCTASNDYWSSSTLASNSGYAWGVSFFTGGVEALVKINRNNVRAVRTGP